MLKVSAQLPQFADLQELKQEISARRAKEDQKTQKAPTIFGGCWSAANGSIREHQYRFAEQSFSGALKLHPDDKKLSGHLLGLLHGYARSMVRDNPHSAEEVLQLTSRLLPGTAVPADLAEAVRKSAKWRKKKRSLGIARQIGGLNAQAESAKKTDDLRAARAELEKNNFGSANHSDVREAAATLNDKIAGKESEFDAREARRPVLYRNISIAATILIGVGLAYWIGNNHSSTPVQPKPSETIATVSKPAAAIAAPEPARDTAAASQPSEPALDTNSNSTAKPADLLAKRVASPVANPLASPAAKLEIRGATPDTRIKLDGVLLARATPHQAISKELKAGEHIIELSRNGFVTKTLSRKLTPGENLVLTDRDLQLQSSDALTLAAANKRGAIPPAPLRPQRPKPTICSGNHWIKTMRKLCARSLRDIRIAHGPVKRSGKCRVFS